MEEMRDLMEMEQFLQEDTNVVVVEDDSNSKGSLVIGALIGTAVLGIGVIAYKKIVAPALVKLVIKRAMKKEANESDDTILVDDCEVVNEDKEF